MRGSELGKEWGWWSTSEAERLFDEMFEQKIENGEEMSFMCKGPAKASEVKAGRATDSKCRDLVRFKEW